MAEDGKSGGNAGLAFIVGGLVVVVIIIGWFLFSGGGAVEAPTRDVDVEISVPNAPAAE
ncbi:hypothetical protein [Brevundimonas sp.]|uniref:hypothetical protein n=1 Tax=Brevundimonas sp. TaxID=1871086 RepID=UPI00391ADB32